MPYRSRLLMTMLALSVGGANAAVPASPPASGAVACTQIPWTAPYDASPTLTPDRNTVVFTRGRALQRRIHVARRQGAAWSQPALMPFSGTWMDMEPAMAPDGSYLVFASNRPAQPGGQALDGYYDEQNQPARGGNLWRVNRTPVGWSAAQRLPDVINADTAEYAPAVAADGSL